MRRTRIWPDSPDADVQRSTVPNYASGRASTASRALPSISSRACWGVAPRSIDNWISRIPEFAAAVRDGRADAEAELDRLLYRRAVGYTETVQRAVVCGRRVEIVPYTRYVVPDARACMRWLCRNMPQDWRRRPDLPSRRALRNPSVTPAHLIDQAVEVVASLHALGVGYVQPVERVVVWHGEPAILRYTRQRRPHTHAGMFWLCNRLPEQWSYAPFLRAKQAFMAKGKVPPFGSAQGRRFAPDDSDCVPTATVNPAHLFPSRQSGPALPDTAIERLALLHGIEQRPVALLDGVALGDGARGSCPSERMTRSSR